MKHQKRIKKLGRNASHRKATLANLASALIKHKRIKTTHAKAKAAQQFVEPLVTKARRGTLHDRRNILKKIPRPGIVKILFNDIAPKFIDRPGGYTRVTKLGFRDNDSASVSLLEFVDFVALDSNPAKDSKSSSKKTKNKEQSESSANQE